MTKGDTTISSENAPFLPKKSLVRLVKSLVWLVKSLVWLVKSLVWLVPRFPSYIPSVSTMKSPTLPKKSQCGTHFWAAQQTNQPTLYTKVDIRNFSLNTFCQIFGVEKKSHQKKSETKTFKVSGCFHLFASEEKKRSDPRKATQENPRSNRLTRTWNSNFQDCLPASWSSGRLRRKAAPAAESLTAASCGEIRKV